MLYIAKIKFFIKFYVIYDINFEITKNLSEKIPKKSKNFPKFAEFGELYKRSLGLYFEIDNSKNKTNTTD